MMLVFFRKAGPLKGRPGLYLGIDRQARSHWRREDPDPIANASRMLQEVRTQQSQERAGRGQLRITESGSMGPNRWRAIMVLPDGRGLSAYGLEHDRMVAEMGFAGGLREAIRQGGVRAQYVEKWGENPSTLGFEVGPGGAYWAIQLMDRFQADRIIIEQSGGYRSFTDRHAAERYLRGLA